MPIRIPNDLPAASALRSENIFVMTDTRAKTQDIRPLKILLLNLMPTKIATETQLARLLGNTPIQVELELLMVKSHVAKNTSEEHMLAFYKTFDQVCGKTYDGMVITARRWSGWRLRTWNTGTSCAPSSSGRKRTSRPRSISAGARRRGCITTGACRNT